MTKIWETALGIITLAASVPLLLITLFVSPYSSIPPQENLLTVFAIVIIALGIGLIHDSTYKTRPGSSPKRRPGFWVVVGTVFVGFAVLSTGLELLIFGTGVPALPAAEVAVVGAVMVVIGALLSRRAV